MSAAALKFQIGARTLATIPRRLRRVALSLDEARKGQAPSLPALGEDDGFLVTSLPEDAAIPWPGIVFVRQRYTRYWVDLTAGEAAWRAGLSGQTRTVMKRKRKRLATAGDGCVDVRAYRTAGELAAFYPLARGVAALTYQERLLGSALPCALPDAEARAWLLFLHDVPIAYLYCGADGDTLRYDYVGHDPAYGALSPGSVLMEAALTDLFADRFARFDFTEGEGQHKRTLATDGIACRDLILLRPTLANRVAVGAVGGFDAAMRVAKRLAQRRSMSSLACRIRR